MGAADGLPSGYKPAHDTSSCGEAGRRRPERELKIGNLELYVEEADRA